MITRIRNIMEIKFCYTYDVTFFKKEKIKNIYFLSFTFVSCSFFNLKFKTLKQLKILYLVDESGLKLNYNQSIILKFRALQQF